MTDTSKRGLHQKVSPVVRDAALALERSHHELDRLVAQITWRVQQSAFAGARAELSLFKNSLAKHLEIEERFAFPVLDRISGWKDEIARGLHAQHDQLRDLTHRLEHALEHELALDATSILAELCEVLAAHSEAEDRVFYPNITRFDEDEAEELLRRLSSE